MKPAESYMESIRKTGLDDYVAGSAFQTTISITDDRHEGYKHNVMTGTSVILKDMPSGLNTE